MDIKIKKLTGSWVYESAADRRILGWKLTFESRQNIGGLSSCGTREDHGGGNREDERLGVTLAFGGLVEAETAKEWTTCAVRWKRNWRMCVMGAWTGGVCGGSGQPRGMLQRE